MLSSYWSLHRTALILSPGTEANAGNWFHNIISPAFVADKGKQRQQQPYFWFLIWALYHQLKQVIVMLIRKFTFLPTKAFLSTRLLKHYVLNTFFIYRDRLSTFWTAKAVLPFQLKAENFFFTSTSAPPCKQSLCRRQGLLGIMLMDLLRLAPIPYSITQETTNPTIPQLQN